HEELDAVAARHDQEVDQGQQEHARVAEGGTEAHLVAGRARVLLALQLGQEGVARFGREPLRLLRPVGQVDEDEDTEHDGGDAPGDVDPLPSLEAPELGMMDGHAPHDFVRADLQEDVRELGADDLGDGCGHEEVGQGPGAVAAREPMRQVDDDAWIEARLGQPQEEAHHVELERRLHEGGHGGHDAPGDHDARDPLPRAPPLDDERARDLEQEIPDEEDAGPEADHRVVEVRQVPRHRQLGDGDVGPVDVRDHVRDEAERDQAPVGLAARAVERALAGTGSRHCLGHGDHLSRIGAHVRELESTPMASLPVPSPTPEPPPAEARTLRDLTSAQKKSGIAAWLGWLFDGLDMHLYTLVAAPFVMELLGAASPADAAVREKSSWIQAAFLTGWALGGGLFGRLGDRLGRSRALSLTILTYAVFTGLSYAAHAWWQLLIFRFLAALGIGGEWAVGSSLLSETWPKRWRPWIAAVLQTGVNIGVLLACVSVFALSSINGYQERWVFLVGILPALLVFWIRKNVPEPEEWSRAK